MTESDIPDATRSVDESVDPAELLRVQSALGDLTFLRPEVPGPIDEMPADVWARLATVLAAESAARATPARRSSRAVRWGGGLVAASVAVVAVGLGMSMIRGQDSDVAVVAGDTGGASAGTLAELAAPEDFSFAGIPPLPMVVDSDMNYTRGGIGEQVASVLERFGVNTNQKVAEAAPAPDAASAEEPASWFTADEQRLRECITKLTKLAELAAPTALMVDRSTYEGQEAGVVVAPEYETSSVVTPVPDLWHVFVVDQDCNLTWDTQISVPAP